MAFKAIENSPDVEIPTCWASVAVAAYAVGASCAEAQRAAVTVITGGVDAANACR